MGPGAQQGDDDCWVVQASLRRDEQVWDCAEARAVQQDRTLTATGRIPYNSELFFSEVHLNLTERKAWLLHLPDRQHKDLEFTLALR